MKVLQKTAYEFVKNSDAFRIKLTIDDNGNVKQYISSFEPFKIEEIKFNDDFVKNFTSDDFEALRDAIILAVNDISREITDNKENMMSGLAGSINIPGLR